MDRLPDLSRFDELAYDTETTGLNPRAGARVFGFSLSTPDGNDCYWDIRENPEIVEQWNRQIEDYRGRTICHNLSFDKRMSEATDINLPMKNAFDTCIQACLINEHEHSFQLDNLARKYTSDYKKGDQLYRDLADIYGGRATKNVQIKNISYAPPSVVAPYAKGDTRSTLSLSNWQDKEIRKQGLQDIIAFERKVTPVLIKAEQHGVRVDIEAAQRALGPLTEEINRLKKDLAREAGFQCNHNPSGDMKKLFKPVWKDNKWWACDGTPLEETDAGNASMGADALRLMKHPAAKLILDLRSLTKTRDTFLVGHILESAENGRVYPTIHQTKGDDGGAGTGRLSYAGPALQQIPDRNKMIAEIVKQIFLPDEGHVWIDADEASFEVRIFAHLVGTPDIIEVYQRNPETDFHQYVANSTGLPRNATYTGQPNAKQLNLSMIFNQGNGTTAEKMDLPWEWASFVPANSTTGKAVTYKKAGPEAMDIIDAYHRELPGVKILAEGCKETAEDRGYLFTRHGRHLRFPKGYKSYKASGILIQATSADENKENWLIADEAINDLDNGMKMLLNTHDSYSFSVPIGDEERSMKLIKERFEADRGLRVPLILEVQHPGKNWWDSKASKRWL